MQILVEFGKHGEAYYDASTPELWALSSVEILRNRLDYYIWPPEPFEDSYECRRFLQQGRMYTDEEMSSMPEDFQALQRSRRMDVEKARVAYARKVKVYEEIKRIVEENDTSMVTIGRGRHERQVPLAWRYVENRSDHEYERVDLVDVWQPEAVEV